MKTYLQRLYDRAAAAPPAAAPALGAQRSQSPLVEADQRLAMPEFSRNFALGMPPEAGEAEEPAGLPADTGIDRDTPRRAPSAMPRRGHGDVAARMPQISPEPVAPASEAVVRPAARVVRDAAPEPVALSVSQIAQAAIAEAAGRQPAAEPVAAVAPVPVPIAPPPVLSRPQPLPVPDDPADWAPLKLLDSPAPPVEAVAPPVDTAPERPAMRVVAPAPQPVPVAPLHPPKPAPLEPLPPDPASIDWDRIEARIAELVARHAVPPAKGNAATASPAAAPQAAPAAAPPPARPRTADAASVIGRIERPARHISLFGARLR